VGAAFEIYSILEYNETNGVSGYQKGVDAVVSKKPVSSLTFNPINCAQVPTGYSCQVVSSNGILSVSAFIAKNTSNMSGTVQSPSSVKFSSRLPTQTEDPDLTSPLKLVSEFKLLLDEKSEGKMAPTRLHDLDPTPLHGFKLPKSEGELQP